MNQQKRTEIFTRFRNAEPEPTTELKYRSNFELLIAVVLSAQATDVSVNRATKILFKIANTPDKILALGLKKLKAHIKTIGLYNTKAENIMQTCRILKNKHRSRVPSTYDELRELPGVGRKTANVILNTAFGQPHIAVDTHIFRVSNRTGIAPGKTPLQVENNLLKFIPDTFKQNAHHWLILHGRYICVARKPKCTACLIKDLCEYKHKQLTESDTA